MSASADFQSRREVRLRKLGLAIGDFEERFSRSSGPGGQHVNKVSTAVTVKHVPTGTAATAQDSRSQSANRQLAWERVLDAIEQERLARKAAARAEKEKARRRNSKRPWGVKQRILEGKRHRSEIKQGRRRADG